MGLFMGLFVGLFVGLKCLHGRRLVIWLPACHFESPSLDKLPSVGK